MRHAGNARDDRTMGDRAMWFWPRTVQVPCEMCSARTVAVGQLGLKAIVEEAATCSADIHGMSRVTAERREAVG